MKYPTCDNECNLLGWKECAIVTADYDLHVSHSPDADTDGRFRAFCHDEQEMITINGWLITDYEEL